MADQVFRFRTKSAKTGEFRVVSVAAASIEEAIAVIEAQEQKRTAYTLDPGEVAKLEQQLKHGTLSGANKARLFTHRQTAPYKIVKGE